MREYLLLLNIALADSPTVASNVNRSNYRRNYPDRARRFELYERGTGADKSDKEFAIRLALSEGAHSSNVLDSAIDARHALNVQGRKCAKTIAVIRLKLTLCRRLTSHLSYSLVMERLSKHFSRVREVSRETAFRHPVDFSQEYDTEPDTPVKTHRLGHFTPTDVNSSDAVKF